MINDQIYDTAVMNPDFMREWMTFLARRGNLHAHAYIDMVEVLGRYVAFLSAEDKDTVASIFRTVRTANDFFEDMANTALINYGIVPTGEELADELLKQMPH